MNEMLYWTYAFAILSLRSHAKLINIPLPFDTMIKGDCEGLTDNWKIGKLAQICNVALKIGNCSFFSKNISIQSANRIMINISTSTDIQALKNLTFNLKKDSELSSIEPIPGVQNKPVETFAYQNAYIFDNMSTATTVQLEFVSLGYCGKVINVTMYYYQCAGESSKSLASYKSTPAPSKRKIVSKIPGNCVKNSRLDSSYEPYLKCYYNDTMQFFGHCICNPGYTIAETSCKQCNTDEYKPQEGNQACFKCGRNSKSDDGIKCLCNGDFYRAIGKESNFSSECYEPPSVPRDVRLTDVTSYKATLNWIKPEKAGSSQLGLYYILCTNCPTKMGINITTSGVNYTLNNLGAFASYYFDITNENNITSLTGKRHTAKIEFKTKPGAPGKIHDFVQFSRSDGTVKISWKPPFAKGANILWYVIKYGEHHLEQKELYFVIEPSSQDETYNVEIFTKVVIDGKTLNGATYTEKVTVNGGVPLTQYLLITFSVLVFVIIVLIASFCVWKKRNPAYLQVVRMEDGSVKLPTRFYTGGSLYVDPKSYADVDDAINDFAYEIDRSDLTTGDMLGSGEFADVYKGTLARGGKTHSVAVKMLKADASKADRDDFLSEAVILGQFNDANVIRLEGVVYQDEPNAIVLEYMINGSLDKFLQEHDMQFSVDELLEMARGVASGMKCLSEMGFVHRDLAARNILVNAERQCKIADFGMSLEIKIDDSTEEKVGKIPVRWTAPEAIQFKKFTTASDVWSYGVVLWEIMSYGERPYWDWSNLDVLEKVSSGYRLPPPMSCPRVVHDLMLDCWKKERAKRPLFSVIRSTIFGWLKSPDSLEDIAPSSIQLDPNLDYTIMQTINKWLEAIGMGRYTQNFLEQGFATPRQILLLTMDDIEALGIGPSEHQKKIYKAIEMTRSQVEAQIKTKSTDGKGNFFVNMNAK